MKIKLEQFRKALETVKPGVLSTESFEQASHFAFTNGQVFSYNDEICISSPVEGLETDVALLGKELYGFINKIPPKQDEIEILYSDESTVNDETGAISNNVTIKAGRIKATFACQNEIKLPLNEEDLLTKGKWSKLPEEFNEALLFVSDSASTDNLTPATNCIHISADGWVEATDKYRLSQWVMSLGIKESVLLPLSSAKVVIQFKPVKIANGKGWVHFMNGEKSILSCRTSNAVYADTSNIVKPTKKKEKVIILPDSILQVVQRAEVFAITLSISIQEKKIVISGTSSETGSLYTESVPYTNSGESFEFLISPVMLKSVLKRKQEIEFNRNVIRIEEKGKWVHIAALQIKPEEVE